jgi:hypothetical protein
MDKTKDIIKYYLYESEIFTEKEVSSLSTDSINDSIREVAKTILGAIVEKTDSIDTSPIDKSRGDIKQLPDLESLQMAITQLETMVERSNEMYDARLISHIKEIERALLNLNKYTAEFKEAYRTRKTLLILKYQSLIMSVFSATSYLISIMIDFSEGDVNLKKKIEFEEIIPFKTIKDFNKSVERGDFKMVLRDVTSMREHFSEFVENQDELLEGYDLSSVLMDGIKMVYNSFGNNPKLIEFLYKAAGIITLLISMREIFYMAFKAKSRVEEVVGHVSNFAQSSSGSAGLLAKLNTFSNKYVVDAEESTKMARREIESENKQLSSSIKSIPQMISRAPDVEEVKEPQDLNFFDF